MRASDKLAACGLYAGEERGYSRSTTCMWLSHDFGGICCKIDLRLELCRVTAEMWNENVSGGFWTVKAGSRTDMMRGARRGVKRRRVVCERIIIEDILTEPTWLSGEGCGD